jgi:glycosyltransferase involved in cell wall biosynthesis
MTMAQLLGSLPPQVRVTVMGNHRHVVEWVAGHRAGTSVEVLPMITGRTDLRGMWAHRQVFRRVRPDIIQFNLGMMSCAQWPTLIASVAPRWRTVVVENSPVAAWSGTSRLLKRVSSPRVDAHLAVGERTARTIEEIGELRQGSVRTMYHGVPDVRHVDPDDRPADGSGHTIVSIARRDPVKGIDVLLRAMVLLPDVHLVQIGGGDKHPGLDELAVELGVADRVEFRELPWDERAGDQLADHDLFVLSSRDEGLPVSIMEAMLAGLAVVATDVGSLREEVSEGETGLLVPKERPEELAAAIRQLLDDEPRRTKMGRRAREIALEKFTLDATVGRYLDLYRELLAG